MKLLLRAAASGFLCAILWGFAPAAPVSATGAAVPQAAPQTQTAPAADGKEILQRKCFQCHQASMWSSLRGDRRTWESVLYRMVGRGALWTEAEVNAMAAFLAQTRGPK
jgi:cytochrome c5